MEKQQAVASAVLSRQGQKALSFGLGLANGRPPCCLPLSGVDTADGIPF